jgi:hypothetical protein
MPQEWKRRLPGILGTFFVTVTTTFWVWWGSIEMFYEGWWGPWLLRLAYLSLGGICLVMTTTALTWPRVGGWLLIAIGGAFTAWWWPLQYARGAFTLRNVLSLIPVSALLLVTGALFLLESNYRRKRRESGWTSPAQWWRRNFRYLFGLGVPLLMLLGIAGFWTPKLVARQDDGDRGARLIEGNGVRLVWAPDGPGWSRGSDPAHPFGQPAPGSNPSWTQIALYGVEPVGFKRKPGWEGREPRAEDMSTTGLCAYLTEDGKTLAAEPQNIWRMPTADEISRSLARHGEDAGCVQSPQRGRAKCRVTPDKETPLWAPDRSPIYYWAADELDEKRGYYVNYAGVPNVQPKTWGNPRHGFRCVKEPESARQKMENRK